MKAKFYAFISDDERYRLQEITGVLYVGETVKLPEDIRDYLGIIKPIKHGTLDGFVVVTEDYVNIDYEDFLSLEKKEDRFKGFKIIAFYLLLCLLVISFFAVLFFVSLL